MRYCLQTASAFQLIEVDKSKTRHVYKECALRRSSLPLSQVILLICICITPAWPRYVANALYNYINVHHKHHNFIFFFFFACSPSLVLSGIRARFEPRIQSGLIKCGGNLHRYHWWDRFLRVKKWIFWKMLENTWYQGSEHLRKKQKEHGSMRWQSRAEKCVEVVTTVRTAVWKRIWSKACRDTWTAN